MSHQQPHADNEQNERLPDQLSLQFVHVVRADGESDAAQGSGNPAQTPLTTSSLPSPLPPRTSATEATVRARREVQGERPDSEDLGSAPARTVPSPPAAPAGGGHQAPKHGTPAADQASDDWPPTLPPYLLGDDGQAIDDRSVHRLVSFGRSRRSVLIPLLKAAIIVMLWTLAVACLSGLLYVIVRGVSLDGLRPYLRELQEVLNGLRGR